jgi:FtsZ-interacting cell division protein ZipA
MPPQLLHAEVDGFQVAIIVLAVIFGFLRWLWETWRGKKVGTDDIPMDEIERQLREEAWRRQTGQQTVPPPPAPSPSESPWEEIRKAWKELREAAQQPQPQPPRPAPPQARQQQQPPPRRSQQRPAPPAEQPRPTPAILHDAPQAHASVPVVAMAPVSPMLQSLRQLRGDKTALRRAIVLQEVFGPPKALQG